VKGNWEAPGHNAQFGYDFWYQPYFNTMISTAWGEPNTFKKGFDPKKVAEGKICQYRSLLEMEMRSTGLSSRMTSFYCITLHVFMLLKTCNVPIHRYVVVTCMHLDYAKPQTMS
jgi:hypothetical protein